ncbi:GNAT family N-acetyltransferase [Ktedonospora formicarum]|uniref:Acetyltransferase, GNAT family protein n=1 Tax=Ktedonospora formicarum TaxID=2778364 RepID=A0A8J3MU20_9CHLR|nr:GNAT family N-acetyltransferase [Ktedonospora formicarum]GHO44975.1 acetyltransferase, GNAT family protein [Ktedonospora formicarum]
MFARRIEEATLNSWPARQQFLFDGWVMRASEGYTKRANSITPLYPSTLPAREKIATCVRFYAHQDLPTIFRLPSFVKDSAELDTLLAQQGYQERDLTHVLHRTLEPAQEAASSELRLLTLSEWLPLFCHLSNVNLEAHQPHRAILERIAFPTLYAVLYEDETPVACGLGVVEHEYCGIFDIVTASAQRRKGYATRLINGMLAQASTRGATSTFLQLVGGNQAAQHLYAKLGFSELYRYWYRIQPS